MQRFMRIPAQQCSNSYIMYIEFVAYVIVNVVHVSVIQSGTYVNSQYSLLNTFKTNL